MKESIFMCFCFLTAVLAASKNDKVIDFHESHAKQRLEKLELFIQSQVQTIHDLQQKVAKQRKKILEIENKLEQGIKNGFRQERETSLFQRQMPTGANITTTKAAFTAYLNSSLFHLGAGQTIKYDKVLTNEGSHYSGITGVFSCPVDGVYVFSFFIDQWGEATHLLASLVVDGIKQVQGVANPTQLHQDVQGGNVAILRLRAGQRVWIENYHPNGHVWASDRNRYDTFSGFLLFQ